VAKDPRGNTLGRGTEITMFLKEDAHDFLKQEKLEELVQRYSEFITFPIKLYKKTSEVVEVEEEEEEEEEDEASAAEGEKKEGELEVEEEEEEEEPAKDKTPKTEKVDKWDWHRVNSNVAIWSRDPKEIADEEYQKFFKAISRETSDAKTWIHFKAEGEVEFKGILFVPSEALSLYDDYSNRKAGIRLYVRKVLIQDDFEDLLPRYLNFLRGVVDSDDLPLNVSRETLQQHKLLKVMGKKLVRKALEMLRKLASGKSEDEEEEEDDEDGEEESKKAAATTDEVHPYIKFWEQFGKSIKMGVVEDNANRSKLAKLLRYKSSTSEDKWISLEDYVENMQEWQNEIYFIAGESDAAVKKSPFLEVANKKKIEVLFLTEPIDEYTFQHLGEFDGHKLQSLSKEGLKFGDEDEDMLKKRTKAYKENFKPLTKFLKGLFDGKVSKVTVSQRVEKSPSIIVTSQYGHTANMERIMRAQTFSSGEALKSLAASRTLELNPRHPIVIALNDKVKAGAQEAQETKDLAYLLYDTALLNSGFQQEDLENFSERMYRTIAAQLGVSHMQLAPEIEVDDEEEEAPKATTASSGEEASHDEF